MYRLRYGVFYVNSNVVLIINPLIIPCRFSELYRQAAGILPQSSVIFTKLTGIFHHSHQYNSICKIKEVNYDMKGKIFISAVLAGAVLCLACPCTAFAEESPDFTYTIINGEATVTGFTGEPVYLEIPETIEDSPVTEIRDNAFFRCKTLRQISLPASITEIGHHAFYECTSLESIVLPASLGEIGMGAFSGCTSLSAVSLPESLKTLPDSCFRSCTSLAETVIPNSIEEIEKYCFYGCTSLSYVSLSNSLKTIGSRSFYMCTALETLYIPPSAELLGFESVSYELAEGSSAVKSGFTLFGEPGSAAEDYAISNGISFSEAADAAQAKASSAAKQVKKVPLWVLLLLTCGGIGFFALSCIIAAKQLLHEKKKS